MVSLLHIVDKDEERCEIFFKDLKEVSNSHTLVLTL